MERHPRTCTARHQKHIVPLVVQYRRNGRSFRLEIFAFDLNVKSGGYLSTYLDGHKRSSALQSQEDWMREVFNMQCLAERRAMILTFAHTIHSSLGRII